MQILYVMQQATVLTYRIDAQSGHATLIDGPVPVSASLSQDFPVPQLVPSPDGHFLYELWYDAQNQQHISVYPTQASGAPQTPASQTIEVAPNDQLMIHPNGRFAYLSEVVPSGNGFTPTQEVSSIYLLDIDPDTGTLTKDANVQATYGPSAYFTNSLYGFSDDGSKLYDVQSDSFDGSANSSYGSHSVDPQTGNLGPDVPFFSTSRNWGDTEVAFIADKFTGDYYKGSSNAPGDSWADIYPYNAPNIHCTISMLKVCDTATDVHLDPSEQYLFFTDPAMQSIRVIDVDLADARLVDTGNSIPITGNPQLYFSSHGSLVYTIMGGEAAVHIYSFDAKSGKLTAGDTVPLPVPSRIFPAERK